MIINTFRHLASPFPNRPEPGGLVSKENEHFGTLGVKDVPKCPLTLGRALCGVGQESFAGIHSVVMGNASVPSVVSPITTSDSEYLMA